MSAVIFLEIGGFDAYRCCTADETLRHFIDDERRDDVPLRRGLSQYSARRVTWLIVASHTNQIWR